MDAGRINWFGLLILTGLVWILVIAFRGSRRRKSEGDGGSFGFDGGSDSTPDGGSDGGGDGGGGGD